jgi:hypothetical protein
VQVIETIGPAVHRILCTVSVNVRWSLKAPFLLGLGVSSQDCGFPGKVNAIPGWSLQEFPQNLGALVANPFAFSVLLIARSGIARYDSIAPETSVMY